MEDMNQKLSTAHTIAKNYKPDTEVIGIQKEKILHKTLKYFLEPSSDFHEIKVSKNTKGVLYADILKDNHIYEIQTRGFNNLRSKLDVFLKTYQVTIVHPIAYIKHIYKISETGEIEGPKKSPKKGSAFLVFHELYKIKQYLNDPNLSIKILLLNMDEYRHIVPKKHYKSSGSIKEVQIPTEYVKEINLSSKTDYINLLDTLNLPIEFTSSMFAKATKLTLPKATTALNVLNHLEAVIRIGKDGRKYLYRINK